MTLLAAHNTIGISQYICTPTTGRPLELRFGWSRHMVTYLERGPNPAYSWWEPSTWNLPCPMVEVVREKNEWVEGWWEVSADQAEPIAAPP